MTAYTDAVAAAEPVACPVAAVLADSPDPALTAHLASLPGPAYVPSVRIAVALQSLGSAIGSDSIRWHRLRDCSCYVTGA